MFEYLDSLSWPGFVGFVGVCLIIVYIALMLWVERHSRKRRQRQRDMDRRWKK